MLQRTDLKNTELLELLSICSLTTKQINFLLHLQKEAQHFKYYPLINREKIQQLNVGRPTYYMYVSPNQLSIVSLKQGELLEKFVSYGREMSWLFADFRVLAESTISVTIFDRQQHKRYVDVYLHFIVNMQFKKKNLFLGKKNIYLCEDSSIGKRISLQEQDIYFSLENRELREIKKEKLGSSSTLTTLLKSTSFKHLENYFVASKGDFIEELHKKFRTKRPGGKNNE